MTACGDGANGSDDDEDIGSPMLGGGLGDQDDEDTLSNWNLRKCSAAGDANTFSAHF